MTPQDTQALDDAATYRVEMDYAVPVTVGGFTHMLRPTDHDITLTGALLKTLPADAVKSVTKAD